MPPDMAVDMRRSKLKASEAALLAGEVKKPSWQSKNEGIHERVSFEDTIWGFDLAGGSFYKTPLRVVSVKADSRAEKAGIRMGDKLTRINDIDTSTLTIQEAHEIIVESGVHLRLAVSAPEDEEDSYYCYEDPVEDGYDSEEERRLQEELERKRRVHAKVSSYWSLQWPWVSKRRVIYRESNCFMVPSKYEDNHRDKFSPLPMLKVQEDIVLESTKSEHDQLTTETKQNDKKENTIINGNESIPNSSKDSIKEVVGKNQDPVLNNTVKLVEHNGINGSLGNIPEVEEDSIQESPINSQTDVSVDELHNNEAIELQHEIIGQVSSKTDLHDDDLLEESSSKADEAMDSRDDTVDDISLRTDEVMSPQNDEIINEVLDTNEEISSRTDEVISTQDDEIINEVLDRNDEDVSKVEEDNILDSILSDGEEQNVENSESIDER